MRVYPTAKVLAGTFIEDTLGHIGDFVLIVLETLNMREGAQINAGVKVIGGGELYMGPYSTIGYNSVVVTGTDTLGSYYMNDYADPSLRKVVKGGVFIEEGAFIGPNVTIAVSEKNPRITIGERSVVMANSYVGRSIPPETIYGKWGPMITEKPRTGEL